MCEFEIKPGEGKNQSQPANQEKTRPQLHKIHNKRDGGPVEDYTGQSNRDADYNTTGENEAIFRATLIE